MTINNTALYDATIAAIADSNGAWLSDPISLDYSASSNAAVAIAIEVDAQIPTIVAGVTISQRSLLTSIVKNVMTGRSPSSTKPSDYASIAASIAAMFAEYSQNLTDTNTGSPQYTGYTYVPGNYSSAPVNITAGNIVQGAGSGYTNLNFEGGHGFDFTTSLLAQLNGVKIQNADVGLAFTKSIDATCNDLIITNCTVGISSGESVNPEVNRARITNCYQGIFCDGNSVGDYPTLVNFNGAVEGCTEGLRIQRGALLKFSIVFQGNITAVILNPGGETVDNTIEGSWFEANTTDVLVNMTGLHHPDGSRVLSRLAFQNSFQAIGNSGVYTRTGFGPLDGSVVVYVQNSQLWSWAICIPPQDRWVVDDTQNLGPIINYGTVSATHVGPSAWLSFLDADSGVVGTSPVTQWSCSQGATAIATVSSCNLVNTFASTKKGVRLQTIGSGGTITDPAVLAAQTGVNKKFHLLINVEFDTVNAGMTGIINWEQTTGNEVGVLAVWGSGICYIQLFRKIDSVAVSTPIHAVSLNTPYYFMADFDGTNLYLSDETGVLTQAPGQLAGSMTPDYLVFGPTPSFTASSGMIVRRLGALIVGDQTDGTTGGWTLGMSQSICRFLKELDQLP